MSGLGGWLAALRERVTGLLFRSREAADLDEELRFHLEMEADRLVREEGLEPGEARRRAGVSFGGVERTKEEVREARGLGWLTGWWLDVKLGARMVAKYPGLTVLGGLSMAFAIFTGAAAFEVIGQVVSPDLPLPEGDRVVAVQLWDVERGGVERQTLHDLAIWREELETVRGLGAYRDVQRNLLAGGRAEPVTVAAMEAEGFRVAGVPALLGRTFVEEDERAGAPLVLVIGHDLWLARFSGDRGVVGTTVRLGGQAATIVGVMPEGFGFPVAHSAWVPFDPDARVYDPREGPPVMIFGRLAAGVSLEDARTEMELIGARMAAAFPESHQHLRPQVARWPHVWLGGALGGASAASLSSVLLTVFGVASNLPLLLFLVLICGNVALLVFARATSREGELVVRSALGASRRRIILQLFFEALVLATIAAVVGLAAARYGLAWLFRVTESALLESGARLPFWLEADLSPMTFLYTAILATFAAAVAGVVPGLRVTRGLRSRLQESTAGGGGFRFGGIWTAVIVLQIAITMIFPLATVAVRSEGSRELAEDIGFAAEEYLSAQVRLMPASDPTLPDDSAAAGAQERYGPTIQHLDQRLRTEPGVRGVAFTDRLPREYHGWNQVEVDGPTAEPADERGHRIGAATVTVDYFDVLSGEIRTGRGFRLSDLGEGQRVVVVNESFVERVMGGRNPVGRRIRYLAGESFREAGQEPGPWHEIVGVVEDLGTVSGYGHMGMYHPAAVDEIRGARVLVHVAGDPGGFASELRGIAMAVDPALALDNVVTLEEITRGQREFYTFWSTILVVVSALALLLSLGGIFAVMQFTVARRTREIGIRIALGASRRRVVTAVFRRPLIQIGLGLLTGGVLVWGLFTGFGRVPDLRDSLFIAAYVTVAGLVCLLACVAPTLRALAVEPTEALRVEG